MHLFCSRGRWKVIQPQNTADQNQTATIRDFLFADDCALNASTEAVMQESALVYLFNYSDQASFQTSIK